MLRLPSRDFQKCATHGYVVAGRREKIEEHRAAASSGAVNLTLVGCDLQQWLSCRSAEHRKACRTRPRPSSRTQAGRHKEKRSPCARLHAESDGSTSEHEAARTRNRLLRFTLTLHAARGRGNASQPGESDRPRPVWPAVLRCET
jgi:hypothetical protein